MLLEPKTCIYPQLNIVYTDVLLMLGADEDLKVKQRKRIRNKWRKSVTLINNPTLVLEKIQHKVRNKGRNSPQACNGQVKTIQASENGQAVKEHVSLDCYVE